MLTMIHPGDTPMLRWAVLLCLVLIPTALVLLIVDRRVLGDEALWLKPLKFHLSLAVHGATILLAARLLPEAWHTGAIGRIGLGFFGAVIVYEALFLTIQAARGVRSHFNDTTPFDAIGGTIMAAGAGVLVAVPIVLGLALGASLFRGGWDAAVSDPLRLATALGLVLAGWLGAQTGGAIGANGGPLVGQSVGAVMPLTGWSLSGGDYRIAHFLGIHAMQALPLIALAFMAILPAAVASALLLPVAAGWAALTLAALSRAAAGLPPL